MNNALTSFIASIEIADKAVQRNSDAQWAWAKLDRATRGPMPRIASGEDTVTMGRASVKLSPAPQSGRTKASRRNWKMDGKRATEAAVMAYIASI